MSRLNTAIKNDVKLLGLLRDEIALHAHLLEGDIKQRWEALEKQREDLGVSLSRAQAAGAAALDEAEKAAELMVESLRTGYGNVRKALKH